MPTPPCEGGAVSTAESSGLVTPGRRGTAGLCRQEPRQPERTATKRILEREYSEYGQAAYQRLAGISVAQIYRFRNSESYRKRNTATSRPGPRPSRSGSVANRGRRAGPAICASTLCIRRPGWRQRHLSHQCRRRSDPVGDCGRHAADFEYWLIPLLEQMLEQFPFTVRDFIPTTAANSSTTRSPNYWTNCSSSRPNHVRIVRETTAGGVQNERSFANTWVRPHWRAARRNCRSVSSPVSESLRHFHRPCAVAR